MRATDDVAKRPKVCGRMRLYYGLVPEAHEILIDTGLVVTLPNTIATVKPFSLPGEQKQSFVLDVIKSLVSGDEKERLWRILMENQEDSGCLKTFFSNLALFLSGDDFDDNILKTWRS